ncbi:MAG: hypothetical protein A0129_10180 [Limnobacter sp. CACIAM 66H1]|uniref:hypothetical protein n=1 Tax=unclassified Limnobacter TaxID=2630203 RepID=UPI0007A836A4|nr:MULTISPECIES: hypothetical protein [unclassified Limnobacter]KYP10925.1 MAG: hypothetical protein A0129_10180 [Limnobacter sp. CACIAM 66H1]MDP3272914.1 hypothetical protein [Limnobacter sp.]MDZ4055510.1 hypothetical protein [Polynucleobacter sp.]
MKKTIALSLVFGLSGTAMAASDLFMGDGTNHVRMDSKPSNLTRAEVLSKTDSSNIANSLDGTVLPGYRPSSTLTRAEVIRRMEGYRYVEFGDGTSMNPWERIK